MANVRWKILAFSGSLALIGLHAFGVYLLPQIASGDWAFLKRSWGFHFWTFYPPYIALSCYTVAIAIAVPRLNQKATVWLEIAVAALSKCVGDRRIFFSVLCILSWTIFYLGRQKYGFLGDGYVPASKVAEGYIPSHCAGTFHLLVLLHGLIGSCDESGVISLRLFSIFWGGLYVGLVCLWAECICTRQFEKVSCAALMIFIGPIQFFFGYIETYAPLPVFIVAFLLSGITALRNDKPPLWATIIFGGGAIMHILLLFLAPALLCLWKFYLSRRFSIFRNPGIWAILAVVGGVFAYFFGRHYASYLLPLYPSSEHSYAILSWWHLWEWINAQILSAPMGWPLLFLSIFSIGPIFFREVGFLGSAALGALGALFVIDPVIGSRDWDISCLSGIPLMGLATYGFYNCSINRLISNYATVFSCVCSALLIIPWIHINHTDRSIGRTEEILADDPGSYYLTHPVEMTLATYFRKAGLDSLAQRYYEKAIKKYPFDRRMPFNLGNFLLSKENKEESIPFLLQALAIDPDYPKPMKKLIGILSYNSAHIASVKEYFHSQHSNSSVAEERLADFFTRLSSFAEEFLEPDEAVFVLGKLGATFLKKGDFKIAELIFEKAYQLAPENEKIVKILALLHIKQKNADRAVQILRQALEVSLDNREFLDLLKTLEQR